MAPDLNSLPPSRSTSGNMTRTISNSGEGSALRGQSPSPLSRTTSTSLQAAAAVNAGLQEERRGSSTSSNRPRQLSHVGSRRRSTVLMNLQLNDPTVPGPGEMVSETHPSSFRTSSPQSMSGSPIISTGDPHHYRTPSLGEIHQELEQEQEAQVNRLLQMIRLQQQQLQQLQAASGHLPGTTPPAIDDSTPTSERSMSFSTANQPHLTPRSPTAPFLPRSSLDMARADMQRRSRTPSRTASPRLRSSSISGEAAEWNLGGSTGGRDESAFYQAETQMMVRENQMLRQRIRELERQVTDLHANSSLTHEPATPSRLRSPSISEEPIPTAAATLLSERAVAPDTSEESKDE